MRKMFGVGLFVVCMAWGQATFYRDVLPVLQKRCQACHREGQAAPMALETAAQARAAAEKIAVVVRENRMPPWMAEPGPVDFVGAPEMTAAERQLLIDWAAGGVLEGNRKQAPPAVLRAGGWSISPDMTFGMAKAVTSGPNERAVGEPVIIPTKFTYDRWVQKVEIRPGDWPAVESATLKARAANQADELLAYYQPGVGAAEFPTGMGKRIPAGADLVLEVQYRALPIATVDQTQIGLAMSATQPRLAVRTLRMESDPVPSDGYLLAVCPAPGVREVRLLNPAGAGQVIVQVKPHTMRWAPAFRLKSPLVVRKGWRFEGTGYYEIGTQ